jgi:hypothetical protein
MSDIPNPRPPPPDLSPRSFADITDSRGGPAGPKLSVRFLRRWTTYFAGDCATFPAPMARRLVGDSFAEAVNITGEGPIPAGAELAIRYPVSVEARRKSQPG